MKIAVIVRSLKFGGMERAACNQADAFAQAGHEVTLMYFSDKNKEISPKEKSVTVIHLDINKVMKQKISGIFWNVFSKIMNMIFRGTYPVLKGFLTTKIFKDELTKIEKEKKFDLILVRGQGTFEQIWGFKEDRTVKICVNVSIRIKSSLKYKLIHKAYYEDSNVVCIANGTRDYYKNKFENESINPKTLEIIKNPFFKEKIINLAKEKNPKILNEPYIVGVGRLVKAKNFKLLIDTYIFLKRNHNFSLKLVVVGDGKEKKFLEKIVLKEKLTNDIIFTGYQSNPYNWMANSEMFVLTSRFEGLCGVLLEAMCCKTRIVACKSAGGVPELMSGDKTKENLVEPTIESLSIQIMKSLKKDKSYYYDDYSKILDSLEPSIIVKNWLDKYTS